MLVKLLAYGKHRIERRQRFLRDESDLATQERAPLRRRHGNEIAVAEQETTASHGKAWRKHLRNGATDHRLSGARFTDEAKYAPRRQGQAEIAKYRNEICAEPRCHGEVAGDEDTHVRTAVSRTSRVRRRPSPSRLNANTVMKIARIGKIRFQDD